MSGATTLEASVADSGTLPWHFARGQQWSIATREVYLDLAMCGLPRFTAGLGGVGSELIPRGCSHRWATLGSQGG